MRLVPLVPVAIAAIALSSCGDDDDKTSSTPAPTANPSSVTVEAREFKFAPQTIDSQAGKLTIELKNEGKFPHELELIKTDAAPDALKVEGKRAVVEGEEAGEIATIEGGATKSGTFDLQAGDYVYICNIPGHYEDGMHGKLTVE